MLSKVASLFVFLSIIYSSAGWCDWHPETVEYKSSNSIRVYRLIDSAKAGKSGFFSSFVLPKGFTMGGCDRIVKDFKDGIECGQADVPRISGKVTIGGKAREIFIEVSNGGPISDKYNKVDGSEIIKDKKNNITYGFEVKDNYFKIVEMMDYNVGCGFSFGYTESNGETKEPYRYEDWKTKSKFDEFYKSMKCVEIPLEYIKSLNDSSKEAKVKGKESKK